MGKGEKALHQQHQSHQQPTDNNHDSSSSSFSAGLFICPHCSRFFDTIAQQLSFRCLFVLILALSVLLSGIFWILPRHSGHSGFDAKQTIKLSATVQGYFRLEKPVRELVAHIGQLEYDITGEIGVPDTKVAILSMHQYGASNWTDVVFGVLSDPMNVPIPPVSVSVLRSSLVELFLKHSNLTLTASTFGQPFMFEILKYPGGITVIPGQAAAIWLPQILFNFTLNNSMTEIVEYFGELKEQLRSGLHLRPYEDVFLQVTNSLGSTKDSPVEVQASLMSAFGGLLPQRLRQLAQTITGSPARNLGLDNSVFGKVKSVRLSSYLKGTLSATPPTPSPAPAPELSDTAGPSISPSPAPTVYSSAPSPSKTAHRPPCLTHGSNVPPSSSPSPHSYPSVPPTYAPRPSLSPSSQMAPHVSPQPVSYASSPGYKKSASSPGYNKSAKGLSSSSPAPAPSSSVGPFYKEILLLGFCGLLIFHLLCW